MQLISSPEIRPQIQALISNRARKICLILWILALATVMFDVLVSLAALYILDGSHKTALELLNTTLQHPSISQETSDQAEGLRVEIERTLTPAEIESARNSTAVHTVESVVKEILEQSRHVFTN